jgi:hypothetical protein
LNTKTVVILIAADGEGYQNLVQAIRETWGSAKIEGFEILYYYGYRENYPTPKPGECILCNDELICGVDRNDIHRNEIAFNYIYNNYNFEYLFRCCAGSYIEQKKMAQFLQDKPKTKFYCGKIVTHTIPGFSYASGAGFFLSRDLVKLLIDNPSGFTCYRWDDASFGIFFSERGIPITNAPRQDLYKGMTENLGDNQFHFHFRRNVSVMYKLHQKLSLEVNKPFDKTSS